MNVAHMYKHVCAKHKKEQLFVVAKVVITFIIDGASSNNEWKRTPPEMNTQHHNPKVIFFAKYFIGKNFRSMVGVSDISVVWEEGEIA